jgi:hypothetical protein
MNFIEGIEFIEFLRATTQPAIVRDSTPGLARCRWRAEGDPGQVIQSLWISDQLGHIKPNHPVALDFRSSASDVSDEQRRMKQVFILFIPHKDKPSRPSAP